MPLVDQFDDLDLTAIDEFVDGRQEENLHLDFKLVNRSDLSYRPDRKNFAKAVSGFANSGGGIIVWGVEANEKNEEGVDYAHGKQELDNVHQFVSKLNGYTGDAASPLVEGVFHKAIETTGGRGFAATLVPESVTGPHMAKLGEYRYYKRSGDSFYKMEHFDIEDMFGRRRRPDLFVEAEPVSLRDPRYDQSYVQILLSVVNAGRGTAKAPYLSIALPEDARIDRYGVDGNGNFGLSQLHRHTGGTKDVHFGSKQGVVIHPEAVLQVAKINIPYPKSVLDIQHVDFHYSVTAEGVPMNESSIRVSQADLYSFLEERGRIEEDQVKRRGG